MPHCGSAASQANTRSDLAGGHGLRIHGTAEDPYLSQTECDASGGAALWCDLTYEPRPSWASYTSFLEFVRAVHRDVQDLRPRDMIDLQSFLWVLGSDEYAGE